MRPASWRQVSAGTTHACAIASDGSAWCWGDNLQGQLGNPALFVATSAQQVGGGTSWQQISAGGAHTCAIQTGGSLWCWGDNSSGQLGTGAATGGAPILVP